MADKHHPIGRKIKKQLELHCTQSNNFDQFLVQENFVIYSESNNVIHECEKIKNDGKDVLANRHDDVLTDRHDDVLTDGHDTV